MLPLTAYVLAGGQSRRFGADKARALLWGKPLILHVVSSIAPAASSVTVIADLPGKYEDLGLRTLADGVPGRGPLGGAVRALEDLPVAADWLLLVPCDLVGISPAWIEALGRARGPGARAVAFKAQRWQPLPALYRRTLLPVAREQLSRGSRALWRLLEAERATAVALPADWSRAAAINTREDLQALSRSRPKTESG